MDEITDRLIENYNLHERNEELERQIREHHRMAKILSRLNLPADFDYLDKLLPVETRTKVERALEAELKEEARLREIAARAEAREKDHQVWLDQQSTAAQAARDRIATNIKSLGVARPETLEQFRGLPDATKVKLLGALGGTEWLHELAAKSKSGVSWEVWDRLKGYDPDAPDQPEPVKKD
jgi:hypothetical protein